MMDVPFEEARQLLRRYNFAFCDQDYDPPDADHEAFLSKYLESVQYLKPLLEEGVEAASTDMPEQSISKQLHLLLGQLRGFC